MQIGSSRAAGALVALSVASLTLAGCTFDSGSNPFDGGSSVGGDGSATAGGADASAGKPSFTLNVDRDANDVPVDRVVEVGVSKASLRNVRLSSPEGKVSGTLAENGGTWLADGRLEPGTTYQVKAVAENGDGSLTREKSSFTTSDLTLDEQTYPSLAPLDGETVGVGMPVIVNFDLPVTDRAAFERQMTVTSTPAQAGSWRWMSDNEAHWRPKSYWKAGTEVSVDVDINGVNAGNGIYGQEDRDIDFTVGDANVYKVDVQSYQMQVFSNAELIRTFPITAGKAGFTTRSGTKVIMEKYDSKRMDSETVGIPAGSSEAYDISNVQYAMRLTNSGEFIHAAPWSVGSQGRANVSHGCTGMSPSDAAFLYGMSKRGDVVEYVGTDRGMEPGNGYADWNTSWADYKSGSAL